MKVEKILKVQQSDIHKKLKENNNKRRSRRGKEEDFSFSDIEKLMRHDCYRRINGAINRGKVMMKWI
ncbi:hypothetical protein [Clostridium ljungdahlii]|uniref:Uncharacterized protein n=1 Tax=Clostridium ljungdahlii (strain ATCC 55383 / DSM 13528 / PETC) TaxID=748727 RepID=D8GQA1_CLOLD|nr:hypothetical protein [Clostridium ljungdahlii]ADK16192.1 hypothetical protein CLJU_c31440 [Clostridium ljungdahlii DSM 13528]OAA89939.1 hypothetical protein WX45_01778 [Clostridium ljungdahlii DSM 13528]